jgi:heme exporter protein A
LESAAFQITDVSKRYGQRWAVARLSFSLERGQSLLLSGHNGSGKSTLLKLLATSLSPTFGSLSILGHDAQKDPTAIRRKVALISHANYLYEDLTAEQNLLLLARLIGLSRPQSEVDEVIEKVGMTPHARASVRTFSAGMRKRISVARMLLKRPELALLDEPFGELDPQAIAQMEKLILDLQSAGTTVVLATHLLEQGKMLTQVRLHLKDGRRQESVN